MRRKWLVATLLVLVIGSVAAAVVFVPAVRDGFDGAVDTVDDWGHRLRHLAATVPEAETEERSLQGESASLLLVVGEPGAAAFALVASGPNAPPSVTVLPQDVLLSVPGFGEYRLGEAMLFEGAELVELSITNQLGIRIDRVVTIPPGGLAAAVGTQMPVELAEPFFVDDGTAVVRRLPAGESLVSPDILEDLLVTPGAGDAFEWVQRQGAAWRSVLAAVAADPGMADRLLVATGPDAADLLVTVAASAEVIVATLPVERAEDTGVGPALSLVGDRIDGFVAERFGHLVLRPEGRPAIEILNGNGRIGSTYAIATILVRRGFLVVRTDNADTFEYTDTLVVAQGESAEAFAREIVEILGHGLLFLEVRAPSGVVDVSIIVGTDVPTGEG
jgi:hypothetical protein